MLKNNKGITLIALVITIIVLLILAGVSIAMLTGDNGILTQSTTARDDTKKASVADKVNMAIQTVYAQAVIDNDGTTPASRISDTAIIAQYVLDNGSNTATESGTTSDGIITVTEGGQKYTVTLQQAGTLSYTADVDHIEEDNT